MNQSRFVEDVYVYKTNICGITTKERLTKYYDDHCGVYYGKIFTTSCVILNLLECVTTLLTTACPTPDA